MKKIAITQRILDNITYPETRDALDVRWMNIFENLNFLPVILPSHYNPENYFREEKIVGLILSGGNDLSAFSSDNSSIVRDKFEERLLEIALSKDIPILGICRGMQFVTQVFAGELKRSEGHIGNHKIVPCKESKFYDSLKKIDEVNSFHNYVVSKIPQGFIPSAKSNDGYYEAMEHSKKKIFCQMWHPERDEPLNPTSIEIMKQIFND
jgi:putative glutamine amidotransferase